jgi:hypothetical protein
MTLKRKNFSNHVPKLPIHITLNHYREYHFRYNFSKLGGKLLCPSSHSTKMLHKLIYFKDFKIIVESHAVVGSNVERFYTLFTQFSPAMASYIITVQCHSQGIGIETIHQPFPNCISFTCTCVLCAILSHIYSHVTTTVIKIQKNL